jgi:hypothetical protein
MNRAIQQFQTNVQSAKQLGVIYQAFTGKVTRAISLDELLRAEIVLGVSALDCYIHDIVRIGMGQAFKAGKGESNAYLSFGVSLDFVKKLLSTTNDSDKLGLFEHEIRRLHSFRTFQTAENISQALSLIGIKSMWEKVGNSIGVSPADTRMRLNLIIDRRNCIAHESDIDPTLGVGNKYPIDFQLVENTVDFLDKIVHAIHEIAKSEGVF